MTGELQILETMQKFREYFKKKEEKDFKICRILLYFNAPHLKHLRLYPET